MAGIGSLAALKRRFTPVLALTLGLGAMAGLLVAIELALRDLPLAGLGTALATGAWMLTVWTRSRTARTVSEILRRPWPTPPRPTPAVVPALSTPTNAATPPPVSAAGILTEPAIHPPVMDLYRMAAPGRPPRCIAVVGSTALADVVRRHGQVQLLHPGMSAAELESSGADTIIVEEDGLDHGPWSGTVQPHGTKLLGELRSVMSAVQNRGGKVYILPSAGVPAVAAEAIRDGNLVVTAETVPAVGKEPFSLLDSLATYVPVSRRNDR